MNKLCTLTASLLLLLAASFGQQRAIAQNITPETGTKAFYAWYIKLESNETFPLLDEGIYRFVARETVAKLRDAYRHNRLAGDTDYFTKVQDYDEQDWAGHIATQPAVMLGDVAVVPVTFGSADKTSVLVFLRKQDSAWRITKVDDTFGYP